MTKEDPNNAFTTPPLPGAALIVQLSRGRSIADSKPSPGDALARKRAMENMRAAEEQARKDAMDTQYLWLTWGFYILILIAMVGLELGFLVHVTQTIGADSPTHVLTEAGDSLIAAYEAMSANTTTTGTPVNKLLALKTLAGEMANFKAARATSVDVGQRAFVFELLLSGVTVACLTLAGIVFAVYRKHKFVRARGHEFLACFVSTGILLVVSALLMSGSFMMVFSDFPSEVTPQTAAKLFSEQLKLQNLIFGMLTLTTCSVCLFFGSFICRLHVIYVIFSGPVRQKRVNYFSTAWVNIVVAIIATIPLIVWRYASDQSEETRRWITAGVWFMTVFYAGMFLYYLANSHVAHREFCDYHSNMRAILTNLVIVIVPLVHQQVFLNSIVASLELSGAIRTMVMLDVLDMLSCACVQIWQSKKIPAGRPNTSNFVQLIDKTGGASTLSESTHWQKKLTLQVT